MIYLRKLQSKFPKSFCFQEIRQNVKCSIYYVAIMKFCRDLVHLQSARRGRSLDVLKKKNPAWVIKKPQVDKIKHIGNFPVSRQKSALVTQDTQAQIYNTSNKFAVLRFIFA